MRRPAQRGCVDDELLPAQDIRLGQVSARSCLAIALSRRVRERLKSPFSIGLPEQHQESLASLSILLNVPLALNMDTQDNSSLGEDKNFHDS